MVELSKADMMKKLEERCGCREPQRRNIEIHARQEGVGARNVQTVDVARFPGLEKSKNVSTKARAVREEIKKMDPKDQVAAVRDIALKHLKEQKAKGNVDANGVKGPNFEKHEMQEVNALMYGFKYTHDKERIHM